MVVPWTSAPAPTRTASPAGSTRSSPFRLWQARKRLGVQVANVPGAWNFSILHTPEPRRAAGFYGAVFGWEVDPEAGGMIRVPGYGDHLASTVDPDIRTRQASAPPGFADVTAGMAEAEPGSAAGWSVTFTVAERDQAAERATALGAEVVSTTDTDWTREARIRDPQGAELVLSQFTPPG